MRRWIMTSVLLCSILLLPCLVALAANITASFRNADTPGDKVTVSFPGEKKASILYEAAEDNKEYLILLSNEELTLGHPPTVSSIAYIGQKTADDGVCFTVQVKNPDLNQRFYAYMSSNAESGITTGELVASFDYSVENTKEDEYTLGDVNGVDGINAVDAGFALQISAGLRNYTEKEYKAADVNRIDGVTAVDAGFILQYSAGLIDAFPDNSK